MNRYQSRALQQKRARDTANTCPVNASTLCMIAARLGDMPDDDAKRAELDRLKEVGMIDDKGRAFCVRTFGL
jgi:hypothetical protein